VRSKGFGMREAFNSEPVKQLESNVFYEKDSGDEKGN